VNTNIFFFFCSFCVLLLFSPTLFVEKSRKERERNWGTRVWCVKMGEGKKKIKRDREKNERERKKNSFIVCWFQREEL
jgi:hypothetical protein